MMGGFLLFSLVLWYLIDWVKRLLGDFKLPELPYKIGLLVLALSGGILLALQFKLDVFVMLAEVMDHPAMEPTLTGQIFGGLVLASGAGGVYELLKAVKGRTEDVLLIGPEEPPDPVDVEL